MATMAPGLKRAAPGDAETGRAKVFWTGRSQAVRLPQKFRLDTAEVAVRREGRTLVLEPVDIARDSGGWPLALWRLAGAAPDFDLGDRGAAHERSDVLAPRARRKR
jgi:hypothetical protein